ncbi:hypothetical protein NUH30_19315 [Leptospira sp. 85282-16]|uniref:Uncharacterized protein n=1 Tax=Leptospira noumeaensis TaxID=2484964 RepID=A0A4R9IA73_9LEPT|nr:MULTISPECIES: hypothetical protein [Leptospira]MCT8335845.1 hypothetical protein [Leptospira sp. 85282-16]TGK82980.1 hypothetical protein EHQ24_08130 [Leptospira noumeaensis]
MTQLDFFIRGGYFTAENFYADSEFKNWTYKKDLNFILSIWKENGTWCRAEFTNWELTSLDVLGLKFDYYIYATGPIYNASKTSFTDFNYIEIQSDPYYYKLENKCYRKKENPPIVLNYSNPLEFANLVDDKYCILPKLHRDCQNKIEKIMKDNGFNYFDTRIWPHQDFKNFIKKYEQVPNSFKKVKRTINYEDGPAEIYND